MRICKVLSPKPQGDAFCERVNFNILKLSYYIVNMAVDKPTLLSPDTLVFI